MTLYTSGDISRYYAETLVLLFFPGSKFPEGDIGGEPIIHMSVLENDSFFVGKVSIKEGMDYVEKEYVVQKSRAEERREMLLKLAAGGAMLSAGKEFCNITPPWGMITGVRPAKLVLDMLYKGFSEEDCIRHFCDDFLCSPQKANLAVTTAKKELLYFTPERRKECSVYIAIPFCPTRCNYCSFVSYASPKLLSLIPEYLNRLFVDIKNTFELIRSLNLRVSTVYIGGGTPTTLSAEQLRLLLEVINESTDVSSLDEFTVEAGRPDTITLEKMNVLKTGGVTRVSVNAQTLNDDILASIGRKHNSKEFFEAYESAKLSGIYDINVDLIAGLPGESWESFENSARRIIDLNPTNITVHTFYVKRAADIRKEKEIYKNADANTVKALDAAQKAIISAGYEPYYLYKQKNTCANLENAGFCMNMHECLYNIFMMEEIHTVFGAGASAMTKLVSPVASNMKIERICETKYPFEYLDLEKSSPEERIKRLSLAAHSFYEKFN